MRFSVHGQPLRAGPGVTRCHKWRLIAAARPLPGWPDRAPRKTFPGGLQRLACANHSPITAVGTPRKCIDVPHVAGVVQPHPFDAEGVEHLPPLLGMLGWVMPQGI